MFTVAQRCQIMDKLGLKDSCRKLVASYAISFVISLYLILHACVQTFDVTEILGASVETKALFGSQLLKFLGAKSFRSFYEDAKIY